VAAAADGDAERSVRAEAEKEFDRLLQWLERTYHTVFTTLRRSLLSLSLSLSLFASGADADVSIDGGP
jgi:hypothetical protein